MKDSGYVVLYDCNAGPDMKMATFAAAVYNSGTDQANLLGAKMHAKKLKEIEPKLENIRVARVIEVEESE